MSLTLFLRKYVLQSLLKRSRQKFAKYTRRNSQSRGASCCIRASNELCTRKPQGRREPVMFPGCKRSLEINTVQTLPPPGEGSGTAAWLGNGFSVINGTSGKQTFPGRFPQGLNRAQHSGQVYTADGKRNSRASPALESGLSVCVRCATS